MKPCIRIALLAVVALGAGWTQAQSPVPYVRSFGEATILAVPGYVEFLVKRAVTAESTEAALTGIVPFETKLREAITQKEIHVAELEISAPAISGNNACTAVVSARLRFPMAGYTSPANGYPKFGKLCDTIRALAKELDCEFSGPLLLPSDKAALEKSAVMGATENAVQSASAVASTMNCTVATVESVEIISIGHNVPKDFSMLEPTLRELSCTAKVYVLYTMQTR